MVGAAESSTARSCSHIRRPAAAPNFLWKPWRSSPQSSSAPPPRPKIPPIREAVAIRSVVFHGSGPSGLPIAAYSPGIISGLSLASLMYSLIPAT